MRLKSVDPPTSREEQQVRVRGRLDHLGDRVLVLEFGLSDPPTTTTLRPKLVGGRGLHIPGGGHREHQWVVVDEILDVELTWIDLQARASGSAKVSHFAQLVDDDLRELVLVAEDFLQACNGLGQFGLFRLQIGTTETGETAELHVENVVGLDFRKGDGFSPPSGVMPAISASRAAARSSLARIVAMISSMRSRALMRPSTMCSRFSAISRRYCERGNDVDLMIDVGLERVEQVEGARHAANERNHVDAKAGL